MILTNPIDHDSRVINEAESLSKDFEVTVLVSSNTPTSLKKTPFKIKTVNYNTSKFFPLEMKNIFTSLASAALKEKPDVFHAHDLDGLMAIYKVAAKKKVPLVYDSHELFYDLPDFSNIKGFHVLIRLAERYLVKKIAAGITVNESIAKFLKKLYKKDFVVVRNIPKKEKRRKKVSFASRAFSKEKNYPSYWRYG